ncbi:outer membrane protein assembly factor BamD [Vibrio sp.]|nr:outer membrane protein assembly factor BamD [Vibrio sp.]
MKHLTLTSILAISLLAGCASNEDIPDVPPSELYGDSQTLLQEGNWISAIEKLEALDSRYPFGAYSEQVQLDLIYAYYKSDDIALALATIDRFTRFNPTHEKADWVLYMRGLSYMALDANFMQDVFNVNRDDRNPEPSKSAFKDFKKLLERYPNSPFALDSQKRLYSLKNRLAEYDLAVADYYLRREAWIATINRTQELQRTFPDTNAARKSLLIQQEAYDQLDLLDAAKRTEELIKLNPTL